MAVTFKIYTDFECDLEKIHTNERGNDTLHTENSQNHIPCSFAYKVVCIGDNFFTEVKMLSINLLDQFLKNIIIAKEREWKF